MRNVRCGINRENPLAEKWQLIQSVFPDGQSAIIISGCVFIHETGQWDKSRKISIISPPNRGIILIRRTFISFSDV